jgi:hypothetical protein
LKVTLIASINNKGHLTLANDLSVQNAMSKLSANIILDSIAMILIRNHKVVAVAGVSQQANHIIAVESVNAIDDNNLQD